jgi:hypothetical protein
VPSKTAANAAAQSTRFRMTPALMKASGPHIPRGLNNVNPNPSFPYIGSQYMRAKCHRIRPDFARKSKKSGGITQKLAALAVLIWFE